MANALELSIKIAGKIDNSFTSAIATASKQTSSFAKTLSSIGKAGLAIEGALMIGTVAALKKCTDYAQEFQVQMADVAKYVDGLTDANGKTTNAMASNGKTYQENYDNMKSELFKLSTQYALTPEELAVMASNLGQSGYSAADIASTDENGNVTGVLRDTATMAAAFDIGTDQAGEWMAKWENAFGVGHEEILTLTDQINYLGNTSATTAAEIGEAVNRAGSLGTLSGVDTGTTAALATVMLQAGGDSSTVGTSLNRIFTNSMKGSSATDTQQAAWAKLGLTAEGVASSMVSDGQATLVDIFTRISKLDADQQTATISSLFGQWAIADVARVVANIPELETALNKVNTPEMYTGSMEAEANVKNSTTQATAEMRESARKWLMDTIGTEFLPVQSQFNKMMIGIYTSLVENMPQISAVASSFATILSDLVTRLGTALEAALPYLQDALNWLAANPETALAGLGAITGTFATMAAAPKIESATKLLFGSGEGKTASKGILGTLFSGGQSAAKAIGSAPSTVSGLWGAAKTFWQVSGQEAQLSGKGGLLSTLGTAAKSLMPSGLLSYGNNVSTAASAFGTALKNNLGGVGTGLLNFGKGTVSTTGQILGGILNAVSPFGPQTTQKIGTFAGNFASGAKNYLGMVGGNIAQIPANFMQTGLGQLLSAGGQKVKGVATPVLGAIGSIGGKAGSVLGAGANLLGTAASPFLSLFSGVAPVIGIISTLIGLLVVFQNHLGDIQQFIGDTFGAEALSAFNGFYDTVSGVFEKISNFINGGWLDAFTNAKNFITQIFGQDVGNAFGALQPALEAVFGFVQQIVTFAQTTAAPIIENIIGFVTGTVGPQLLQLFTTLAPLLGTIGNFLGGAIMTGMTLIGNALSQIIIPAIETVITGILNFANVVAPVVVSVIEGIVSTVTGVINAIIGAVNYVITNINNLSFDIPEWVPLVGGKHIGFSFSPLPMLANGGFTNGPSIAGEAGTEAVISFKASERAANLATWTRAGQMLGAGGAEIRQLDDTATGRRNTNSDDITFAPVFQFYGDVTKEKAVEAGQISFAEFKRLCRQLKREEARTAF